MRRVILGVSALVLVVLVACSSAPPLTTADAVQNQVRIVRDEFSALDIIAGPMWHERVDGMSIRWQLVTALGKETAVVPVIVLRASFEYTNNRWLFLRSARAPGGEELTVRVLDREVIWCGRSGSCTYLERLAVVLPMSVITAAGDSGGDVRVQVGAYVVTVPRHYALGYLNGVLVAMGRQPAVSQH